MTTIRVAKRERFTTVTRATVNDKNLSFRARGVLFWLLDKPDDWSVDSEAIARHGVEGREAVRTALRELEAAGYLLRRKSHDEKGQWRTDVWVFETPNSSALSDSATSGFLGAGLTSGNGANGQVGPGPRKPTPGEPTPDSRALTTEELTQTTETSGHAAVDCEQCHGTGWYVPDVPDRNPAARKCDHRLGALAGGAPIGGQGG